MSDRSTCPTNSSTVARESDKDLAGPNPAGIQLAQGQAAAAGSVVSPAAVPTANLEKASVEPTQKSVVVPLLYDPPSPASSSSVGASQKPALAKAPPAPVENKVPQLPLSSSLSSSQLKQQAAPAKPVQAPASGPSQQVAAAAPPAPAQVAPSAAKPAPQAGQAQQQPASLLAKIQPKPAAI